MNQLPPVKNVCRGCLSRNRILQIITHEELKKLYFSIIDKESFQQHCLGPLVLCWECITKIHKYKMFRHQCALAHKLLVKYLAAPSPIRSLSKLTIVKNNVQITIPHTSEESQNIWVKRTPPEISNGEDLTGDSEYNIASKVYNYDDNHTKYKEDPYGVNGTSIKLNSENKSGTNDSAKEEIVLFSSDKQTDVQFIKVEDDASLGLEELYIDDSFNDQDDIDNKEFSIEEDLNDKENSKLKSKRRKKKITENEFDDSDEEPLKNKKRKKDLKEKKHKKKKDKGKATSKAKVTGGKREKPAGVVSNARVLKKLQQLNVAEGSLEMVVLSWEEVEEERQKALLSIVFTRHKYRCHDCIVGFNHKFKLDNHMKKHDPTYGEMECSVCKVRCKDSHALCAHRRRHRVRWRCCECGATWSRAAVAADHVAREHHAPPPTHTCSVCGHSETSLGKLRNHIKNHAERQKCELCGKTFRDRTSLRTHLFIHKGEKEFGCARCGKRFLFKKALELHLVTHDASALLYCVQCDMNFKNRMSFTQHMKYSLKHIDPAKLKFSCALCDKRFAKAARLREHHVAVHLKATPVRCHLPGCSFACSSRPVLRTHIRMVHRNARAQRNHVCDACGKTYTTKKSLEGHLRSHSGARPFACARCAATFGYEAALYNHNKLVHLRDKTTRRAGAVPPPPTQQATEATGHIP